jgi:hypothetical protein
VKWGSIDISGGDGEIDKIDISWRRMGNSGRPSSSSLMKISNSNRYAGCWPDSLVQFKNRIARLLKPAITNKLTNRGKVIPSNTKKKKLDISAWRMAFLEL